MAQPSDDDNRARHARMGRTPRTTINEAFSSHSPSCRDRLDSTLATRSCSSSALTAAADLRAGTFRLELVNIHVILCSTTQTESLKSRDLLASGAAPSKCDPCR